MVNIKKIWIQNYYNSDHRKSTFYQLYMNPETAPQTREFQSHCSDIKNYINDYLQKTNRRCFKRGTILTTEEKWVIQPANIIQSVFKGFKTNYCKCCRSSTKRLDSAHTILTRPQILKNAIEHSQSELGEEDWVEQAIEFIQLHTKYPVITLCKECHRAMDKIHEPVNVKLRVGRGGIKIYINTK